jgi:hypothetical protein
MQSETFVGHLYSFLKVPLSPRRRGIPIPPLSVSAE